MPGKPDSKRAAALRAWEETFGSTPPPYLSVTFLQKAVVHEIQCRRHGGHSAATKRALRKIAEGRTMTDNSKRIARAGAHLVREWNGRTYQVEVPVGSYRMD